MFYVQTVQCNVEVWNVLILPATMIAAKAC